MILTKKDENQETREKIIIASSDKRLLVREEWQHLFLCLFKLIFVVKQSKVRGMKSNKWSREKGIWMMMELKATSLFSVTHPLFIGCCPRNTGLIFMKVILCMWLLLQTPLNKQESLTSEVFCIKQSNENPPGISIDVQVPGTIDKEFMPCFSLSSWKQPKQENSHCCLWQDLFSSLVKTLRDGKYSSLV